MTTKARTSLASSLGKVAPILPFVVILGTMLTAAVFAPLLALNDPYAQSLVGRLRPPGATVRGATFVLGTDELGRDLLSRLVYGARVSLLVALSSVLFSGVLGVMLGMTAAFLRGLAEGVIMRIVDVVLSVPTLLFAIIAVAVLGPGLSNVVLVLVLTRWPRYARVAYGQTLAVAGMPYVRLARFMGASWPRTILRHVLPNITSALIVVATLEFGIMVLFEAGLSFLGLGVQAPTPSWGTMLAVGRDYVGTAWWLATLPGLCLFLLILSANMIGDYVRDLLDPRLR